ncbi:MAG TPA: DOMON-like domain-containing protein [Caulobacteraceae bacterium]|nr:DOMON-like domain-containing protein [Caulobacteraceae bacterium]
MRLRLIRHRATPCEAVAGVDVVARRPRAGALALTWLVAGRIGDLAMAPVAAPARADGLWRHTCFEAFVAPGAGEAYFEFNFAPSAAWAAYRFSGYRADMAPADGLAAPVIEVGRSAARLDIAVRLDLGGLRDLAAGAAWRLGLAAVIEEAGGRKSYWALAHPSGAPDFHHAAGLAGRLASPEPS